MNFFFFQNGATLKNPPDVQGGKGGRVQVKARGGGDCRVELRAPEVTVDVTGQE